MSLSKKQLNPEQKEAVEYVDGPLLIVAGAGTGKTTVITEKIAYLIEKKLAQPHEILALAFNEKAALEMRDRVSEAAPLISYDLSISTFHSFAEGLLRDYGTDIGINRDFKIFTDTEKWTMARENLYELGLDYYLPLGNPSKHISDLLNHFEKAKDELVEAADYMKFAQTSALDDDIAATEERNRLLELASVYQKYNQMLLNRGAMEFADLIFFSVKLLEKRPSIKQAINKKYKYVLVDEFQDVNFAEYRLVKLLSEGGKLFAVGDDDQGIYAFRGASVRNIMRFKKDFPEAKEIVLSRNYRSGKEILDLAYESIKNNNPDRLEVKLSIDKRLVAETKEKSEVSFNLFKTGEEESRFVAEKIMEIKKSDPSLTWDDFAILIRANSHAEAFASALERVGIPYEFIAATGLFRQKIVLDCLAFLKLIENNYDSNAFFRLMDLPFLKFDFADKQKIFFHSKKKTQSYFEILSNETGAILSKEGLATGKKIISLIKNGMEQAAEKKPTTVLYDFLEKSGYLTFIAAKEEEGDGSAGRTAWQLRQFFDYLEKFENASNDASVRSFVNHYQYVLDSGDAGAMRQPSETPDSVNILTVHTAKGLEFAHVFVVNLVEDRFPSRAKKEGIIFPEGLIKEKIEDCDQHIHEERRLFYVAMTRAKQKLFLTAAVNYGTNRDRRISRFVSELNFEQTPASFSGALLANEIKTEASPVVKTYPVPEVFSFSQLNDFDNCPYSYKLKHVLSLPTKEKAVFSFGKTLHNSLRDFYEKIKEINAVRQENLFDTADFGEKPEVKAPPLDELLKIYEDKWIDEGFEDRRQKEEYRKKGREVLRNFYETQTGKWTVPVFLESAFQIKIGGVAIKGRVDFVEKTPDNGLRIIDFKSGKSKEKLMAKDKEQLLIYQFAFSSSTFAKLGEVKLLTYRYLEDGTELSFIGKEKDFAKLENKIQNAAEKIKNGDFRADPDVHKCKNCDFFEICEFRAK